MQSILNSFKYAIQGIKDSLRLESNLKIHFITAFLVILWAYFLRFTAVEFAVLFLTIAIIFLAEFVNTIVERICDFIHPEKSEKIREIKDVSAGMVLITSVISAIIGLILFLPKL